MIENPKWKRCSFFVPSVEGYEESFYGINALNDALAGKLGGIVSKEEMIDLLKESFVFVEVQGLYLSNAPEGYSCYVYKQPFEKGSFRWISLPRNFSIESAEALVESVFENDIDEDYKNLFGVQKQMKKAKEHALLKLDAIVAYDKVMNFKSRFNPRLAMAMKKMGKVLEKEKGYDFHYIETEKNLEVFATGEEISPTKILVFKRIAINSIFILDYRKTMPLLLPNEDLMQIRDYFFILAATESHQNARGQSVTGFPFRYDKDLNIDEIWKQGFSETSYYIQFLLKCFQMFGKGIDSSIFAVPEYVQTMLNKRKGLSQLRVPVKGIHGINEFDISNEYIPFTVLKPGWRERGNRGNPSQLLILKGTKIVAKWAIKVNRAGNKLIESLPMIYIDSKDEKLIAIKEDISKFLQEGSKQLEQQYYDDYFGNIVASLIAYLNKKYIDVHIPLSGGKNSVFSKSIHRWNYAPTYAYFLHGEQATWEQYDFLGLDKTEKSTELDKMVFYDEDGYWYKYGEYGEENDAPARLINCYNEAYYSDDNSFLDATYDEKGNLTGFTLEEPSDDEDDNDEPYQHPNRKLLVGWDDTDDDFSNWDE